MSAIARKSMHLPARHCATVEGWTCDTCGKPFGLVTIEAYASPDEVPADGGFSKLNQIPKFCPHCGAQFDRWVP